jgi:3-hydroxy-5-methyl-1-naphthoate 3-O-methyltransferase
MSTTPQTTSSRDAAPESARVTPQRIMQFAWGFAAPLVIDAALRHRVFDVLDSGPKTVAELAGATGASARGLRAILDALVGLELLTRQADRYAITPESSTFLVSSKPLFHGGLIKHLNRQISENWKKLPQIVASGKPATEVNDTEAGADFFREFVEDLFPMNFPAAKALADHLAQAGGDANRPLKVLDLAAGSGVWGIAIAQRLPQARITAVDWPKVAQVTQDVARRHGVGDRLTTLPGDLLEVDFGRGYNVATLGHILHSEGEARSRRLLAKVFDALAPGGTIAIAEFMPNDDRTGPPIPLLFGVNMLVHTQEGDVFTFPQLATWLREAGFKDARKLEAPAPSPLILATSPAA